MPSHRIVRSAAFPFHPLAGLMLEALREDPRDIAAPGLAESVIHLGPLRIDAGERSEWLIPLRKPNLGQNIGPWPDQRMRKLKADLQERSGVKFRRLKTFRATFAQDAKDHGVSIEAVSRAMRHRTTKTTETYYARIRADNAFAELDRAFQEPVVKVRRE